MKQFIIEPEFLERFPQVQIAVVVARGITNTKEGTATVQAQLDTLLREAEVESQKYLGSAVFSENPVVAVWRQAYQQFKTKKGVRCSIEALLKRVERGVGVSSINPLVDIYNAISLRYGLPCGGEDIDTFCGDLRLTIASGGEA